MHVAQLVQGLINEFHGVIGTNHNTRTQEQTFNIIAPIELERNIADFFWGKSSSWDVGIPIIQTVGAIKNTFIGKENFQKRDTSSVSREGVTDPWGNGIAHSSASSLAVYTTGGAGDIIFSGSRQNCQLVQ